MPDCGNQPARLVIPACIGCGAMRRDESCPEGCSECRTELVNGADYDKLAAAACRDRLRELRAVAGELARAEPAQGGWKVAYEALQRSARQALLRSATPAPGRRIDAACYERERSRAAADRRAGQSLAGPLGRLAFATPRPGQWKRSLRALQAQARRTPPPA